MRERKRQGPQIYRIQSTDVPESEGARKGEKKDRTVKTSVFPFIIRNSDKENGP